MKQLLLPIMVLSMLTACGVTDPPTTGEAQLSEETKEEASTTTSESVMFGDPPETSEEDNKSINDIVSENAERTREIMAEEYKNTRKLSEPASVQSGSVTTTITDGLISYHEAGEYARHYGEGIEEGDMVPVMELDITLENNVEDERTVFIDQLTIVSSDGHQVDANGRLSDPPVKDMLGAVKSDGTVVIPLSGSNMWESEWVDVYIPRVYGAENSRVADEQKVRIYFDSYK